LVPVGSADGKPAAREPAGIEHRYAPLGGIAVDSTGKMTIDRTLPDYRKHVGPVRGAAVTVVVCAALRRIAAGTNAAGRVSCRSMPLPERTSSGPTPPKPPNKEHVALAEKLEIDVAYVEALAPTLRRCRCARLASRAPARRSSEAPFLRL